MTFRSTNACRRGARAGDTEWRSTAVRCGLRQRQRGDPLGLCQPVGDAISAFSGRAPGSAPSRPRPGRAPSGRCAPGPAWPVSIRCPPFLPNRHASARPGRAQEVFQSAQDERGFDTALAAVYDRDRHRSQMSPAQCAASACRRKIAMAAELADRVQVRQSRLVIAENCSAEASPGDWPAMPRNGRRSSSSRLRSRRHRTGVPITRAVLRNAAGGDGGGQASPASRASSVASLWAPRSFAAADRGMGATLRLAEGIILLAWPHGSAGRCARQSFFTGCSLNGSLGGRIDPERICRPVEIEVEA